MSIHWLDFQCIEFIDINLSFRINKQINQVNQLNEEINFLVNSQTNFNRIEFREYKLE